MKVLLEHGGIMPEKKHPNDTTWDIKSPIDFFIGPFQRWTLWTGVRIDLPEGTVGLIRSKTGNIRDKGILCDGVVDSGYKGQICITLVNTTKKKIQFYRGDKVAQLVILPAIKGELEI